MNESYNYSAQLYDLYGKGKEACSIFQVEIRRLVDSINPEKDTLSWSDEERKMFEDTFKRLDQLSSDWYGSVMGILNQIPLISLRARFSAAVKTTEGELCALYPQYLQASCMKVLLRLYDTMKTRTERLPDILRAYEEFCRDTENAPKKRGRKDILHEDRLDGRITVDEYDEKAENITQQMHDLDDELVKLEQGSDGAGMTVSNLLKLAANVDELFKSSKPAVKNQILRLVVSNLKIQQKKTQLSSVRAFCYVSRF